MTEQIKLGGYVHLGEVVLIKVWGQVCYVVRGWERKGRVMSVKIGGEGKGEVGSQGKMVCCVGRS